MSAVEDGWWWASSPRATFTFQVLNGSVVTAPPIGWSLLGGKPARVGIAELRKQGFEVLAPTEKREAIA